MPHTTSEPTQPPERSDSAASQRTPSGNDRPPWRVEGARSPGGKAGRRLPPQRPSLWALLALLLILDLDKLLVGRQRPPLHHLDRVTGHSYPSGHTAETAAVCAVLVIEGFVLRGPRPHQFAALVAGGLLVAGVAFSRVYLGVHYPSDVVAGAVLGVTWPAVASRLGHLWTSADERSELAVCAQGVEWESWPMS
jgi:PAP2 superfamily